MHVVVATVVRIVGFVAGEWVFTRVYEHLVPATQGDANLGEGLLVFMLMVVAALLWGAWDGYRRGLGQAAAIWVATGAGTGTALAISLGLGEPGRTQSMVLADVASSAPFLIGLVLVPGVFAAAATALLRQAVSSFPTPH